MPFFVYFITKFVEMNVIREDVNATSALLKVAIAPADYQGKVAAALEKYRKTAKIPGFRPGKVPMGLIQKQYGKSVLAEEMNKLVNESLYQFINENKIEILGNPIPKEDREIVGDFNNPADFEFTYEIGLAPAIKIPLSSKDKFDFVSVNVDEELISKQIDDLRRRYGKLEASEKVGDTDLILAQFTELNEDGSVKEGGIVNSSTISMEFVEDKATKKALTGKKVGDEVVIDPAKVSRNEQDLAAMLSTTQDKLAEVSSKFNMKINEVRHMVLADLNEELYTKLFGPGIINSEDELKARVKSDLEQMFTNDTDRLLMRDVYEHLMDKTEVALPSDFLKRWIQLSNEKPITIEEIEAQFEGYENGMKWQLIQGAIFKQNEIKVEQPEVIEFTKGILVNQYAQYGIPAPEDTELTQSAIQVLSNKDESAKIYDMLAENKMIEFFKNTVKLNNKSISYDDFVALASK